jgi:pre-mRNA-splicing factor CDC5/CEF1
LESNY